MVLTLLVPVVGAAWRCWGSITERMGVRSTMPAAGVSSEFDVVGCGGGGGGGGGRRPRDADHIRVAHDFACSSCHLLPLHMTITMVHLNSQKLRLFESDSRDDLPEAEEECCG